MEPSDLERVRGSLKGVGKWEWAVLPLLQWRNCQDLFLEGFFLQLHPFCAYLTSTLSVTVCAAQVLAVKNSFSAKKAETEVFSVSLLADILNEELVLAINESEFALS